MPTEFMQDKLKVKIYSTRDELGKAAADDAAAAIRDLAKTRPVINIIFAAAPSQAEFLAHLATAKGIDFTQIAAFQMDEYAGLPKGSARSFAHALHEQFFKKVGLKHIYPLHCHAADPKKECERFTKVLEQNPPDLVFMGIGENAHIAFNDPGIARFDDPLTVKLVELMPASRQQQVNDGCFPTLDDVPTHAMTMTVPALMRASRHFCMVPAKPKAQATRDMLEGPIDESCPATILRLKQNAILYLDTDSAGLLTR